MKHLEILFIGFLFIVNNVQAQSFDDLIHRADSLFSQDYLKADSIYTIADSLARENKDEIQQAIVLTKKAMVSTNHTEYDNSLKLLEEALNTFTKLKDTLLMAQTEQDMGLVYRYTKDYVQAAAQNKKALDLWKTLNDSTLIGIGYRDLGVIYRKQKRLEEARECYTIAATYLDPEKNKDELVTLRGNLSTLELTEGNYQSAIALNKEDLPYIRSNSKWRSLSTRFNIIAHAYLKLEDYTMALRYADSSVMAAQNSNMLDAQIKSMQTKSKVFYKKQDYKSAYTSYKQYKRLSDSAFTVEKAKEVARIITINDFENRMTLDSINFASKEAMLEQTLREQRTQKWLYFSLGLFALFVAASLWFGNKQRKKISEQQLKENILQQKLLAEELKTTEREATQLIEEAKLRSSYKHSILDNIDQIFENDAKNYKKGLAQLQHKLKEDLRHESESLFAHDEIKLMRSKLDEKLQTQYPKLTQSERKMCSYVIAGLSIKEIAEMKQTTLTAVKAMRYRIRKKLDLDKQTELRTALKKI